jgi:Zn finger protein HypA/HybF involved in hydrogenase expression
MEATKNEIRAEWSGWIVTYPDPANPARSGGSTSLRGATLPELIADIFKHGTYYVGCGYRVVAETLELQCMRCRGEGEIPTRRGATHKRCPACKGRGVLDRIADVELSAHDNVKIEMR